MSENPDNMSPIEHFLGYVAAFAAFCFLLFIPFVVVSGAYGPTCLVLGVKRRYERIRQVENESREEVHLEKVGVGGGRTFLNLQGSSPTVKGGELLTRQSEPLHETKRASYGVSEVPLLPIMVTSYLLLV